MVEKRSGERVATGPRQPRMASVVGFLLVCIVLPALQLGCQKGTSSGTATALEAEPQTNEQTEPQDVTALATPIDRDEPVVSGPRISVEENVHDFGEVGPETLHSAEFTFTNTGKAPLKILEVKSCCGVVTRGVKAGQEYAPGKSGKLALDFRASVALGTIRRNLYLKTNDPKQSTVPLTIKAKVVRRVEPSPTSLKLFTKKDNAGAQEITLTSIDGKPFSIKSIRSTGSAISVDFDPAAEATKFVLTPKVDLEKLPRNRRGQISIDLTHPECKNVRIPYDVLPEFTFDTSQIIIFKAKQDEPVERHIWVISNYQDDFEIESVSSTKGIVDLKQKEKVGNRYHLTLDIVPPAPEDTQGVVTDELEVKIKGSETLSAKIRLFYATTAKGN